MAPGDIAFPNLNIYLSNVPKSLNIGGFSIALYGIIIAVGMLCGCMMIQHEARISGQSQDLYWDVFLYGVVVSIIGARIYYVVFQWDFYSANPAKIFAIREGGLAIYGGVIGAFSTCYVLGRLRKVHFLKILDTCMTGLLTGQVIGRWGNFTNREAFGEYTNSLFSMALPLDAVRSGDVTELMRSMIPEGANYILVTPTFLYESCWNFCLILFLIFFRRKNLKAFTGEVALLYLGGYGLGRFFIEGIRTDSLMLPGTQIAVSRLLAGVLFLLAVIIEIYMRKVWLRKKKNSGR